MMQGLLKALHKVGKRNGKFVFAIAARPEPEMGRLEIAVADTTAIPGGQPVRDVVDIIVAKHVEAVRALFAKVTAGMVPEVLMETLQRDPRLPERSWKADDVGQA